MKSILILLFLLTGFKSYQQAVAETYPLDSSALVHEGVPKGELIKLAFDKSRIFPGTWREFWVYIPAQYQPEKPACVYVSQDGVPDKAITIFDNLIASGEMPVTIGVFVAPGRVRAGNSELALDRYNRSFEYDGLGDAYARFLLEEIFPEVEKQKASDGRAVKLSKSGNDRAIGGYSSGAICAFTAAWERPKEFSRVFSAIGTYVAFRGGDRYSSLIRKYEPKPLRIFLQDGSNDVNIYGGDWWMANQMMERALTFGGYEVSHVWGSGGHNGKHGGAVFPDALRWLWKDWPKPVSSGKSKNQVLSEILLDNQGWELVGEGYGFTEGLAANTKGEVFFQDIPNSKTYHIELTGKVVPLNLDSKKASGIVFDRNDNRYAVAGGSSQILKYDSRGNPTVVADHIAGNDMVMTSTGNIYVTVPDGLSNASKIYLIKPDGKKSMVDEGLKFANGIALTPDQQQLYITESASHWVWIYTIAPDGSLNNKQQYGWLHQPDKSENAWPDGVKCDTAGRVYVASRLGIQIMDQLGRVNAILPLPAGQPSNLCFGGTDFNIMYVSCGDKIWKRKLNLKGSNNFDAPYKPMIPKL